MTSRDFCYWLQGYFELSNPDRLTSTEISSIRNHLNLVFFHEIDPSYSDDPKVQETMNQIHGKPDKLEALMRC